MGGGSISDQCGLYVPSLEERIDMGVEHQLVHPNHERHDDLMGFAGDNPTDGLMSAGRGVDHIGRVIELPNSAPRQKNFPPFLGATRNFSKPTQETVDKLHRKCPDLLTVTYPFHGRRHGSFRQWQRGMWGIDSFISDIHTKANAAEEEAGARMTYWAVRQWDWLGINYLIYWNWMIDDPAVGWFWYEPYRLDYKQGDQNIHTSKHEDHFHLQKNIPYVAGNN